MVPLQRVWALSGTKEEWNLALSLIGWPCVAASGKLATNGTNFPSFSSKKVLTPRCVIGIFYKAVVRSVLLLGWESWTVTGAMWTVLKGFCHRVARRMADMMAYRGPGTGWIYPPLEEALKEAGLCAMEHCVNKHQQCTVDYISTRPIWVRCNGCIFL